MRGFFFETYVNSEAIADVTLGMPVKIKVEAFDFQKYGTLDGTIEFIAPDSTPIEGASSHPVEGSSGPIASAIASPQQERGTLPSRAASRTRAGRWKPSVRK